MMCSVPAAAVLLSAGVASLMTGAAPPTPSSPQPTLPRTTSSAPDTPGGDPLTLMTFNIRYATAADGPDAWEHRRDLLAATVRAEDPDVIGVQEALRSQLDDLAVLLPGYEMVGVGRDDGRSAGEHAAILYRAGRFSIAADGAEQGTFWLSDTPEVPGSKSWGNSITRICTWVALEDNAAGADGSPPSFYVFNIHFDHQSQPSRERAAELVAERMAGRADPAAPAVLMGDFNAGESNPVLRYLRGEAERASSGDHAAPPSPRLRCAFRAAHPDAAEVGTFNGFKGVRSGEMIDHILIPPVATVLSARIVHASSDEGRFPSDHFPVVATVRLAPSGGR